MILLVSLSQKTNFKKLQTFLQLHGKVSRIAHTKNYKNVFPLSKGGPPKCFACSVCVCVCGGGVYISFNGKSVIILVLKQMPSVCSRCCQVHDYCYSDSMQHEDCWGIFDNPYTEIYSYQCDRASKTVTCKGECDQPNYRIQKQSLCQNITFILQQHPL